MTDIAQHLQSQFLPAGFVPVVEEVVALLMEKGWAAADDLVTIGPGLPRIETALQMDDGSQAVRVIDLVRALNLIPLLPDNLSWIVRHPSWGR